MLARLVRSPALQCGARRSTTPQWLAVRHVSAYYSKKAPDVLTREDFNDATDEGRRCLSTRALCNGADLMLSELIPGKSCAHGMIDAAAAR